MSDFRILIVEDDEDYAAFLQVMINDCFPETHVDMASTARGAISDLMSKHYDLCILDYKLENETGLDVLETSEIRQLPTAFIFITAHSKMAIAQNALEKGAMDYLIKGEFEAFQLEKSVTYALHRKEKELEMLFHALSDPLTGLGNRAYFEEQLIALTSVAKRNGDKAGVLFIDLNKFKPINDTYGHDAGDAVLIEVACRLKKSCRIGDVSARLGGDEFAMILPRLEDIECMPYIADKIRAALTSTPYDLDDGVQVDLGASIGTAMYPDDSQDTSKVLKIADERMYNDKGQDRR